MRFRRYRGGEVVKFLLVRVLRGILEWVRMVFICAV